MAKLVFHAHSSGYIGGVPAPKVNAADAGGWVPWEQRNSLVPAPKVNAVVDDGGWLYVNGAAPSMIVNAAVDDGGWVLWENRNTGAAPTVNNDSEWSDYIKPEVK